MCGEFLNLFLAYRVRRDELDVVGRAVRDVLFRRHLVGHDVLHLLERTVAHQGGDVEFRIVDEQEVLAVLLDEAALDLAFERRGVRRAVLERDARAREEDLRYIIAAQDLDDLRSDERLGRGEERTARREDIEVAVVGCSIDDVDTRRDDGQAVLLRQVRDHVHRGRAGVDVDDIAVVDEVCCHAGNLLFGIGIAALARGERFRAAGRLGEDNAAVDLLDEALLFELCDIAAYGVLRDLERITEIVDRYVVHTLQQFMDAVDSIDFHERSPASAPEAHGVSNHYTTYANRHSRNNQFMSRFVYFHYKRIVGKKQEKTEKSTIFHGLDGAGTASLKQHLSYRAIMITHDYQKK